MPHKHTRKSIDKSTVNLPPSVIARPLSVSKSANSNGIFTSESGSTNKRNNKKRKRKDDADDTPKAFLRLMAFQSGKRLPKGLDDGVKRPKPKKAKSKPEDDEQTTREAVPEPAAQVPQIRVGEKLSEFSARVDQALPILGLASKGNKKDPLGLKVGRTKTEKRMHKMYAEWREEDERIKAKRQEELDLAEGEELDEDDNGQVIWKLDGEPKNGKKSKGKKKRKLVGEVDDDEDDPWAQIKKNRGERKIGLNDVALAPPTNLKPLREKFKARGTKVEVDDVPKASGSLRRREELGEVRKSVVEGYRQMMKAGKERKDDGN